MTTTKDTMDDCVRLAVEDLRDKGVSDGVALDVVTSELAHTLGRMIGHRVHSVGELERLLTRVHASTDALARASYRRARRERQATGGAR